MHVEALAQGAVLVGVDLLGGGWVRGEGARGVWVVEVVPDMIPRCRRVE